MVYGWYHGVPPEIWNSADFSSQDPFERALLERRMEDSAHAEVFLRDHAEFFFKMCFEAKRQILDEKEQMDAEALC